MAGVNAAFPMPFKAVVNFSHDVAFTLLSKYSAEGTEKASV
jgi:hypothetical protein